MRILSIGFGLLLLVLLFPQGITAQQVSTVNAKKSANAKISKAAEELSNSLNENDEVKIAGSYEKLAQEFIDIADYTKGEEYLKKALESYTRLNRKPDLARVTRSLARVQENQSKYKDAIQNYQIAGEIATEKNQELVNQSDAKRLKSAANPAAQYNYVNAKIQLLEKESRKEEVADAYVQKAEMNLQQKDKAEAIESYNQAISFAKDKPETVIKLKNEIAKVYTADNHFDGVGTIVKKLFEIVKPTNAYFGEKDFQQLQIVRKLVKKHKIPVNIIGCPIHREASGLAMSSRNERLSEEAKEEASLIYKVLLDAKQKFSTKSAKEVTDLVTQTFAKHPAFTLEYFEIADETTLLTCKRKSVGKKYRGFIAVFINNIRLIDNIALN